MIRRIQCLWRGHDDKLISGLVSALHYAMFGVNNLDTFIRYDQGNKNWMEIYAWKCNHCGRLRSATEKDVRKNEKDLTAVIQAALVQAIPPILEMQRKAEEDAR